MLVDSKIKKIRERADKDFYFFCKHVLGYTKMKTKPHQELCDFIQKPKRKKLVLMPRGSFKSSVTTVGFSVYSLVKNPNLRILVAGETQKNATKFVKEIRAHFQDNDKFRRVYGDWVSKDNIWRDNEFIINRRTIVKKESSVMAASLEKQSTTSQHYDLIILDDPCSQNNVNSPDQIQKTIDYYKLLLSVLEPDGMIIVIGTRYSPMDLYGYLSDPDSPEKDTIDITVKEAIDDDGNLLFPEVLTKEFLEEQRKSQGEWIFHCQYLNRPVSPDTCFFPQSGIKFYNKLPEGLIYFITFDPAVSQKARADYSGIIVNGVDHMHNWYIAEAIQEKLAPSEIVDRIFDLVDKYKPMCVAMEKYALEQVLKINLIQEMTKRNVAFPLKEVPTDTRVSKENRIRALQPRFANGQIYIHKDQKALYHQILTFPVGCKNDDLIDALKSQLAITFPSPNICETKDDKYAHLSPIEQKIWKQAAKMGVRKVHRTWRI